MKPKTYDVAIVGCGPVGATLANFLRLYGYKVAIFERFAPVFYCPRAGGIDDETLRIMDTLGIYDRLNENGDFFEGDLYFCDANEKPIGSLDRRNIGEEMMFNQYGYYKQSMFYQPGLERTLRDAYKDDPLIDSFMPFSVLEIIEEHDHVKLKAQAFDDEAVKLVEDGKVVEVDAKYVVGCDGANSMVRKLMDVDVTDFDYSETYLILDAIVKDDAYLKARFPDGAKFIMDPVYAGIVGKGPHNGVRLDFRVHKDSVIGGDMATPEDFERAGNELIQQRKFDLDKLEIIRRVTYTFQAMTPDKWRKGRLLVAGDAAHLTPPWSGQGLNMGIRDAANMALKMHLIFSGKAGSSLLETYTQERRPSSLKTIAGAVQTGKLMESTNPFTVLLRNVALRLTGKFSAIAKLQFKSWQNKPPFKNGLIGRNHPLAGTWMIQPKFADRFGNVQLMDKFIGLNFALLSTGAPNGTHVYRFMEELGGKVMKIGVEFQDHEGRFMDWCLKNKVHNVLIRPDRYIFDAADDADELCASLFDELDRYGETDIKEKYATHNLIGRTKMRGLKIFNGINGFLYSVYGILGVFKPDVVFGANALEAVGVHGTHSIRALWGAICVMGLVIFWKGLNSATARSTTLIVALVSAGLVVSRLLGYALDGTEGMLSDQRGPLIIEGVMTLIGGLLFWRSASK